MNQTSDQKISAHPCVQQMFQLQQELWCLFFFLLLCLKMLLNVPWSNWYNYGLCFPHNLQQHENNSTRNQAAGKVPASFWRHAAQRQRGHVGTPSKQWHVHQECRTSVLTLSWHVRRGSEVKTSEKVAPAPRLFLAWHTQRKSPR